MPDTENGLRWWIRYVLVPLVGTGGIVAVIAAWVTRPSLPAIQSTPSASASQAIADTPPHQARTPSQLERARTASAKWIQAIADNDVNTVVELSGEPIHLFGETILTKGALLTELQSKTSKPGKVAIKDFYVEELVGETAKLFPFVEQGDYVALVPGIATPPLDNWIAIHLRPRGDGFIVIRAKETKLK